MCYYNDKIWINDIKIIYRKWYMIFPSNEHTKEQNVNSIVRFILFSGIILSIMNNDIKYMLLSNIVLLIFTFMYQIFYVKRSYFTEKFGNLEDIRNKLTPNYFKFAKDAKLVPDNNCKQDSVYHKSIDTHGKGTVECDS